MHDLNYENSDSYRGSDLSYILAPSYRAYGTVAVNNALNAELEKLGIFLGVPILMHNLIDSDCNGPVWGESFIKARRPKQSNGNPDAK